MGFVNVYGGMGRDFEQRTGEGRLSDICPDIDFSHAVALVKGRSVGPDFTVEKDSVVFVRRIPTGVTAAIVTMAVVGVCAGVAGGILLYQSRLAQEEAEKAMKTSQLDDVEELPFCRGASNQGAQGHILPYMIGEAYFTPYRSQPKTFHVSGFRGEDQQCLMSFEAGYRNLVFKKVFIGDHLVWDGEDAQSPQNGRVQLMQGSRWEGDGTYLEFRQGEEFTDPRLNVKTVSDYYRQLLEHPYHSPDDQTWEPPKPFASECPENTMAVDVCVLFDGLRRKDGDRYLARTVRIRLWWSNLDDPDPDNLEHWHEFADSEMFEQQTGSNPPTYVHSGTFTYNSKRQMRFMAHRDFTASECFGKKISIRAYRDTPQAEKGGQENCYLYFINSSIYDPQKSTSESVVRMRTVEAETMGSLARLALVVKAEKDRDTDMDRVSFVAVGTAPVWNGSEWSQGKVPTVNPASWLLEVMTSDVHVHSRYSREELDLQSFGAWYEYCEERGYRVGGAVYQDATKESLCSQILAAGDASLVKNTDGLYSVAIDKKETVPVALLNSQDVMSPKVAKNFCRRADGTKVTILNRETWKEETFYVMRDGRTTRTPTDVITEDSPKLITDYAHAVRYTRRRLAQESLQPKTLTVDVGPEGAYYPIYSLVKVQLPQIQAGTASSVIREVETVNGSVRRIRLCAPVRLDGARNGIVVFAECPEGSRILELEVTGSGETDTLELSVPLPSDGVTPVPHPGNVASIGILDEDGKFDTVTRPYKVTGFSRKGHGYTLELKDYSDAIYEDGPIPDYVSVTSPRPRTEPGIDLTPTSGDLMDMAGELSGEVESLANGTSLTAPAVPAAVGASAARDGLELSCAPGGTGLSSLPARVSWGLSKDGGETWEVREFASRSAVWTFDRTTDGYPEASAFGTWRVRARDVNAGGVAGPWSDPVAVSATGYGTWTLQPPVISTLHSQDGRSPGRTFQATLENPARGDGKTVYGNIRWQVQVRRPQPSNPDEVIPGIHYDADGVWSCPATSSDPYASDDNYRDAQGTSVECGGSYIQTLPLAGQSGQSSMIPTHYQFRFRAVNEAHVSGWSDAVGFTATIADIYDFVRANKTVQQEIVESLSAISANLGEISQGSFNGSDTNFWTLSTKNNAQPSVEDPNNRAFQGAFMVGDGNQYFRSKPVVELRNGQYVVTGYELSLKASNISFSSSGDVELGDVDLKNGTYIYDERDPNIRLGLSANGISIQRKVNASGGWDSGNVRESGVVRLSTTTDSQGHVHTSFMVTDDPASVPEGIPVQGVTAYHMNGSVTDENGQDPASLGLDATKLTDGDSHIRSSFGRGSYRGDVTVASPGQSCVVLTRMDSIYVNGYRVGADGTTELIDTERAAMWNEKAQTDSGHLGLTQAQYESNIFKTEVLNG